MSNRITIESRLSADPEIRYAASGTAMCTITVPDQKRRLNQQTQQWENASDTTWFRATVFKEAAEALAEVAKKGSRVIVTGELITREYETKQGEKRQSLEIDFAKVALIPDTAQRAGGGQPQQQGGWNQQTGRGGFGGDPNADPWATQGQQTSTESPF